MNSVNFIDICLQSGQVGRIAPTRHKNILF